MRRRPWHVQEGCVDLYFVLLARFEDVMVRLRRYSAYTKIFRYIVQFIFAWEIICRQCRVVLKPGVIMQACTYRHQRCAFAWQPALQWRLQRPQPLPSAAFAGLVRRGLRGVRPLEHAGGALGVRKTIQQLAIFLSIIVFYVCQVLLAC